MILYIISANLLILSGILLAGGLIVGGVSAYQVKRNNRLKVGLRQGKGLLRYLGGWDKRGRIL